MFFVTFCGCNDALFATMGCCGGVIIVFIVKGEKKWMRMKKIKRSFFPSTKIKNVYNTTNSRL